MRAPRIVLILAVSMPMVAAYIAVADMATRSPSAEAFPGWVAAVVPAYHPTAYKAYLSVTEHDSDVEGTAPTAVYNLALCLDPARAMDSGPPRFEQPLQAMLLMGGDARLKSPMYTPPNRIEMQPVAPQALSGLVDLGSGSKVDLGPVDALPVNISDIVECVPELIKQDPPGFVGTPVTVTGRLTGTLRHQPSLLGLDGPRFSESWPLVGALPSPVPKTVAGTYRFEGLPNDWVRPAAQVIDIYGGELPARTAIEDSRPALSSPTAVQWTSRTPIAPSARLLDLDRQGRWQQALVAATLLFGIATSLLAEPLLHRIRHPRRKPGPAGLDTQTLEHEGSSTKPGPLWATALVAALMARQWTRRGRPPN